MTDQSDTPARSRRSLRAAWRALPTPRAALAPAWPRSAQDTIGYGAMWYGRKRLFGCVGMATGPRG
eukprot:461746-Pyramimonas_sp.AAC.1